MARAVSWQSIRWSPATASSAVPQCGTRCCFQRPAGHGSVVEDSLLLPDLLIGRNVVLRRAIIDSHCVLPDVIRIGVDPDQDRSRFTVSEKGVTLVTPAMLGLTMQAEA